MELVNGGRIAHLSELGSEGKPMETITLDRMRLNEIHRFLRRGIPIERQPRDHPKKLMVLVSVRQPTHIIFFSA